MGFTSNVGKGGICFAAAHLPSELAEQLLAKTVKLAIDIEMPISHQPTPAVAAIVWVQEESEASRYLIGLRYVEIERSQNNRIMPQLAGIDTAVVAKDERRFPIDFGILESKETIFEVTIPDNFVITYMPDSVKEQSPWFDFSAHYQRQGKSIVFTQKTEVKKDGVSKEEYSNFKKFLEGVAKRIKQRVVLERVR